MLTAGVDLATEASRTAPAVIDWQGGSAALVDLRLGVDDEQVVALASVAAVLGIDCPFGWPEAFVSFVTDHQQGAVTVPADELGADWRRHLAFRETDRVVRATTGFTPLSVAADRIGLTAMRCAHLLTAMAERGHVVDRSGAGGVIEVCPAASLHCWGLPSRGYKRAGGIQARRVLFAQLRATAPWLAITDEDSGLCIASDDALDAVVAALTSRAAAVGRCHLPSSERADLARREGWIMLPDTELTSLVG